MCHRVYVKLSAITLYINPPLPMYYVASDKHTSTPKQLTSSLVSNGVLKYVFMPLVRTCNATCRGHVCAHLDCTTSHSLFELRADDVHTYWHHTYMSVCLRAHQCRAPHKTEAHELASRSLHGSAENFNRNVLQNSKQTSPEWSLASQSIHYKYGQANVSEISSETLSERAIIALGWLPPLLICVVTEH